MTTLEEKLLNQPKNTFHKTVTIIILTVFFIWSLTAIDLSNKTDNGLKIAKNILLGLITPDTELLFTFSTQGVPYLLIETMAIAL